MKTYEDDIVSYKVPTEIVNLIRNKAIEMLNNLPENRPLYKDSGLWQIRSDDMESVLFQQEVNEPLGDFITRVTQLKVEK